MNERSPHGEHGRRRPWVFGPFEIAVCGYKNSGKTTLLEGMARMLAADLRIAYLKHDAHHFTMDHAGKDTDRLRRAGAAAVRIRGANGFGHLGGEDDSDVLVPYPVLSADAVLVEGYKGTRLPRMAMLDEALAILDDPAWNEEPPVAVVHPWPVGGAQADRGRAAVRRRFGELPWLCRDDISAIVELVRSFWKARVPPLHGLVLTGGHSTRMGQDKALLDYHGCTQVEYAVRMLEDLCASVRVSCRPDQQDEAIRRRYSLLPDRFLGMGPTGGLLTALGEDTGSSKAWLVLACDMPHVDVGVLRHLVRGRNAFRFATAFEGDGGLPEPLCAIWEPKAYPRLLQFLGMGHACPRKCLVQSPVQLLVSPRPRALDNGNSPQDRRRIRDDLHAGS